MSPTTPLSAFISSAHLGVHPPVCPSLHRMSLLSVFIYQIWCSFASLCPATFCLCSSAHLSVSICSSTHLSIIVPNHHFIYLLICVHLPFGCSSTHLTIIVPNHLFVYFHLVNLKFIHLSAHYFAQPPISVNLPSMSPISPLTHLCPFINLCLSNHLSMYSYNHLSVHAIICLLI